MDLRFALLLVGLFIITGVALSGFDKLRFGFRRLGNLKKRKSRLDKLRPAHRRTTEDVVLVSNAEGKSPTLPADSDKKILKSDAQLAPPPKRSVDFAFNEALQDLENAAFMPLNLSLSLEDPESEENAHASQHHHMPDEKIDFIISLPGKGPVSRDKALGIYKQNEYLLEKPHQIFGLGHKTGLWSNLEADKEYAQYSDISLAIQLADARGAVSESELNTFVQLSLKLADALHRPTKLSKTFDASLQQSRELDSFCEANDVLASINIVAPTSGTFSGRAINQAATKIGMQFGAMNIYHMKNPNPLGYGHLFSLANLYAPGEFKPETINTMKTRGLTMFMNVPCSFQPVRVFEKMIESANGLTSLLGGTLQDYEGKTLTDQGIRVIRAQIDEIAVTMQNQGIMPGSESAMRLFNGS